MGSVPLAASFEAKLDEFEASRDLKTLDAAIAGMEQVVEASAAESSESLARLLARLSNAYGYRLQYLGTVQDGMAGVRAAARAIEMTQGRRPEYFFRHAQACSDLYEQNSDSTLLTTALHAFNRLADARNAIDFEEDISGLAWALLLQYERDGNATDLERAYGLTMPVRYAKRPIPAGFIHAYGAVLHCQAQRRGSADLLEYAMKTLELLNRSGTPVIPHFAAAYEEVLLDRNEMYAKIADLDTASKLSNHVLENFYYRRLGVPANLCALGRSIYLRARMIDASHHTSQGAFIMWRHLDDAAANAVEALRAAVGAYAERAVRRPIALGRLGEALTLHARFTKSQATREEAVEICREALRITPPNAPCRGKIERGLGVALKWYGLDPEARRHFEIAAGSSDMPIAALDAAADWSLRAFEKACDKQRMVSADAAVDGWWEVIRASQRVAELCGLLSRVAGVEGRLKLDRLEDSTIIASTDIAFVSEDLEPTRWQPGWMRRARGYATRLAFAWAQLRQYEAAIRSLENPEASLLGRVSGLGRAVGHAVPETGLEAVSAPIVYLLPSPIGTFLLARHATEAEPRAIFVPEATTGWLAELLQGKTPARLADMPEDIPMRMGVAGPSDWAQSGIFGLLAANNTSREGARKQWEASFEDAIERLALVIMPPLERMAGTSREMVLAPSGLFAWVPWSVLWLADAESGQGRRYLTDTVTIRVAAGAGFAARHGYAEKTEDRFVGIADPEREDRGTLPYAAAEVSVAASTFGDRRILQGAQATKSAVLSAMDSGSVVHCCCHGAYSYAFPLHSTLFLAGADRLYLRELATRDLRHVRLFVLSACETGKPGSEVPDAFLSLAAGLLAAGAQGVIASSWYVGDAATGILMLRFYHDWRVLSMAPAEALREAQRWFRETTNQEKVNYLGGFMPALGGVPKFDVDAVTSMYRMLMLEPPEERKYAHPQFWGAFTYYGV